MSRHQRLMLPSVISILQQQQQQGELEGCRRYIGECRTYLPQRRDGESAETGEAE